MPPHLVALTDGPNILLDKPILLIGRHQECDIQIPSRKISRRHCCIAQVNDHLVVRDLGSTNGIRVNGVRVLEGKLESGDELIIGNFKYKFELTPASPEPVKAAQPAPLKAPKKDPSSRRSPFDSNDEPVALAEEVAARDPLGLMIPINRTQPPKADKHTAENLDDLPAAIVPESMSLEPMSEDYAPREKLDG